MRAVSPDIPGCHEQVIAEDQPEYMPIPVAILPHDLGRNLLTRWRFTPEERAAIAAGADLYVGQLNGGGPFTPILIGFRWTFVTEPAG
jgi:hypothetical protein